MKLSPFRVVLWMQDEFGEFEINLGINARHPFIAYDEGCLFPR